MFVVQIMNSYIKYDVKDSILERNEDLLVIISCESVLYCSYIFIFVMISLKLPIEQNNLGTSLGLAFIKKYNCLVFLTTKNITLNKINDKNTLCWMFSAPLLLKSFSKTVSINIDHIIYKEFAMHVLYMIYNFVECNVYTYSALMCGMYTLYASNLLDMYRLKTPNRYFLLYGWVIIGIFETVYIVGLIDIRQHVICSIINDMIVKGIIYGFLSFQEITNTYSGFKIKMNHLQIMNDICKLITDDDNIILSQIKRRLTGILHNDKILKQSKIEMSEMVYCKRFSQDFTRSLLRSKSKKVDNVCILFTDIVKYSEMCNNQDTHSILMILDQLYKKYDEELEKYDTLQKIENIGDCYFVTSILDKSYYFDENNMEDMVKFACSIVKIANEKELDIRVGIHYGSVSVGIIGKDIPRFAVVGKNVNIAARLESTSDINKVHISKCLGDQLIRQEIKVNLLNKKIVYLKNIGNYTTYTIDPYE